MSLKKSYNKIFSMVDAFFEVYTSFIVVVVAFLLLLAKSLFFQFI